MRADAVPLLAALLAKSAHDVLRGGHLTPLLEHFSELLGRRASAFMGGRSVKVLVTALSGLEELLSHIERVYVASRDASTSASTSAIAPPATCFPPTVDLGRALAALHASTAAAAAAVPDSSDRAPMAVDGPSETLCRLIPQLLEAWLECAPGSLATAPEALPTRAMHAALVCLRRCVDILAALGHQDLYAIPALDLPGPTDETAQADRDRIESGRRASSSKPKRSLSVAETLSTKLPLFFPLGVPAVKPSREVAEALVGMNLEAARLLAACVPSLPQLAQPHSAKAFAWLHKLAGFYLGVIEGGTVLPAQGSLAESSRMYPPTPLAFQVALEGALDVLGAAGDEVRLRLLESISALATRAGPKAEERALCVRLMLRVLRDPRGFCGAGLVPESCLCTWLRAMPKMLWEGAAKRPDISRDLLRCIHAAATLAPPGSEVATTLGSLQTQLCPLILARVDQGAKGTKVIIGPLAKLPLETQWLLADLFRFLGPPSDPVLQTAVTAALHPAATAAYPVSTVTRLLHALLAHEVAVLEPQRALRLLGSLILGPDNEPTGTPDAPDVSANLAVVDVACGAMARGGFLAPGLAAVTNPFCMHRCGAAAEGAAALSTRRRHGILRAAQFALATEPDHEAAAQLATLTASLPALCVAEALAIDWADASAVRGLRELLLNLAHALGPSFLEPFLTTLRATIHADPVRNLPALPSLMVLLFEALVLEQGVHGTGSLLRTPSFAAHRGAADAVAALCSAAGEWNQQAKLWTSEEAREKARITADRLLAAVQVMAPGLVD